MTRHDPEGVRRRILDATIAALTEIGYGATTTLEVQRRAGISRGTLQHHFPTRPSLMAATVEAIGARRHADTVELSERRPGPPTMAEALVALRRAFTTQTYYAELELWIAARTDPDLRAAIVPVEQKLGRELSDLLDGDFTALPARLRGPSMRVAVEFMRGLAATDTLRSEPPRSEPPGPERLGPDRSDRQIRREIAPLLALLQPLSDPTTTIQELDHDDPPNR